MIRYGLVMAAVFGMVGAITTSARAESPLVTFDVATALPCKVVSVADDAQRPDARKLVEVVFKISALLESGSETDLSGLTYTISSVREQGQMQVADFLPKTELYTDITEPIVIIESSGKEAAGTLGVNYQLTPSPKTSVTASAGVNGKRTTQSSVQYKKLAPKAAFLKSSTKDRRRSVVYKLHPSPQTTLEGERVFSIIFEVPAQWSADWVLVTCEASCVNRGDKAQVGLRSFAVGLYLEDNQEARQAAERLSVEQQRLSDALEQACKDAETQSNWVSWLKTAWKWYGYLQRFSRPTIASAQPIPIVPENVAYFEEYLPENVKNRFTAVNEAKRQLEALSGSQK